MAVSIYKKTFVMMWIMVIIHPKVSNSLLPKLLWGVKTERNSERVMPAALRESMTLLKTHSQLEETLQKGCQSLTSFLSPIYWQGFPLAKFDQKPGGMGTHWCGLHELVCLGRKPGREELRVNLRGSREWGNSERDLTYPPEIYVIKNSNV